MEQFSLMPEVHRTDISDNSDAPAAAPIPESSIPVIQEFKGNATLLLNPGGRFPFSIGLAKAKMVLANVGFILRFVDSGGKSVD